MLFIIKSFPALTSGKIHQIELSEKEKDELILRLYYSLKDYARISIMKSGSHNGNPVIGGRVSVNDYASAPRNSYIIFEFPEAPILNDIAFHLWDYDDRIYTYSIDVLSRGQWKNVVDNIQGRGIQYVHFEDVENVKAIRMKGTNTVNQYLHLLNDRLSFRYRF